MIAGNVEDGNPLIILIICAATIPFLVGNYCITRSLIQDGAVRTVRVFTILMFVCAVGSLSLVLIDPTNPGGETLIPMWVALAAMFAIQGTYTATITEGLLREQAKVKK